MTYQQIERDFVLRTLELLEQYDNCELKPAKKNKKGIDAVPAKYEVTLLINCLLGLIVLPKARYRRIRKIYLHNMQGWGIDINTEMRWGLQPQGGVTLSQVVRRMRNSVAHFNITVLADATGRREIRAVEFEDVDPYKPTDTFYMKVSVEELRTFVTKLAETLTSTKP